MPNESIHTSSRPEHSHYLDNARRELHAILLLPCSNLTIAQATQIGNRAQFALQILDDATQFTTDTTINQTTSINKKEGKTND